MLGVKVEQVIYLKTGHEVEWSKHAQYKKNTEGGLVSEIGRYNYYVFYDY